MDTVTDLFINQKIKLAINIKKDDVLKTIKEKIFLSYDLDKNFITPNIIAIGDGVKYITSDKEAQNSKRIFVYNLIKEIEGYVVENISFLLLLDEYSDIVKNLYKSLKPVYTSLTENDLLLSIKYILLKTFNVKDFSYDIKQWEASVKNTKKEINEKYSLISYDDNTPQEKLKNYLFYDEKSGDFLYSILNFISTYKLLDEKLDILKIIKEYPLDKTVPVMITSSLEDGKSMIKIYKNFPKEKIQEWYINRDDETGVLSLKRVKGLSFKLKSKKDNFSTVILARDTGRISIRSSWFKKNYFNYDGIYDILKGLSIVVKKIGGVLNKDIMLDKVINTSINFTFNTKKYVSLNKLKIGLKKFNNLFSTNVDTLNNDKNIIDVVYLPDNLVVTIRIGELFDENSGNYFKTNNINVSGISNKEQITSVIKMLGNLLASSDEKTNPITIFKDYKFQTIYNEEDSSKPIDKKEKLNIKELRNKGVLIDSVNCQKDRQPTIYNDTAILPNEKSYDLIYKGNRFLCNNKSYIYPGFTNKNILCCFSKDQRKKPVFIRNIDKKEIKSDKNTFLYLPDSLILKTNIITTGKILENERIGLLQDSFYKIFPKNYYRLGVYQSKTNFLNVILRALKDDKTDKKQIIEKIKNLPDDEKKKFLNSKFPDYTSIYDYIDNEFLDHKLISDLFSYIFKVNIIVFDVKENSISCKKLLYLPYKKYIFILKNNKINYELIIQKVSKNLIEYVFNTDDEKYKLLVKNIIELYKKSCILNYTGYPTPPLNIVEMINKGISVKSQIINAFNKVVYISTKELGLIPVIPTKPLQDIKISNIKKNILKAKQQYDLLLKTDINYLQPKGQILNSKNKDKTYGIVTSSGLIIPTQPSENLLNVPVIHRILVENIDTLLKNKTPNYDARFSYNLNVYFKRELYHRLKLTLSKILNYAKNNDLKKAMNDIINDTSYYKTSKAKSGLVRMLKDYINSILLPEVAFTDKLKIIKIDQQKRNVCSELKNCDEDKFCTKKGTINNCLLYIEKPIYDNYIKKITTEMISKSNKNDIMNGTVQKEFIGKDRVISRQDEIVLTTEKDLLRFF